MKKDYQELAKQINTLLITEKYNHKVFKRKQIVELLRKASLRTNQAFVTKFIHKFMKPLDTKGDWVFQNEKPIYYMDIKALYEYTSNLNRVYLRNYKEKHKQPIVKESTVDDIQAAIDLLKSKGYKIYKPTTEYVEI